MANPLCPTGCDSALAPVEFDFCNPEVNSSEIRRIFVAAKNAEPFTDWSTASEWISRIDQTDTTDKNAIRILTVIGSKAAGSPVTRELSDGRTKQIRKDQSLSFQVDENNDTNYEFFRMLECSGTVKFWYETKGGKLYGGNNGIVGDMIADEILNSGADEIATFDGTITWKAKFSPERTNSPIFDNDFTGEANGGSDPEGA